MAIVDRNKAEALIQQQLISAILQGEPQGSTFLSLARRLPNMTSNQTRVPVLDMLPVAYWLEGDTDFKQTAEAAWDNVFMNAAELAVIVPFPEAVLNDASFDLAHEIQTRLMEAIYQKVDQAVLFGIGRPAQWQNDILTLARNAGNNVALGATPDYYNLLLGDTGVIAKIERFGHMSTGAIAATSMRGKLRGIRTSDGVPLFQPSMQGSASYALDGAPIYFPKNGAFDATMAQLIVGDWSQAVYAIRQDITVTILTEGVIQDPVTKAIVYNLAQQDMNAIRVVFRMGWATPNPAGAVDATRTGCAFAYLEPATAATAYAVTVTVKDAGTQNVPGATVELNGSRIVTNASGVAVFQMGAGVYPMTVKKTGFKQARDSVTVTTAAVAKAITLAV